VIEGLPGVEAEVRARATDLQELAATDGAVAVKAKANKVFLFLFLFLFSFSLFIFSFCY